MADDQMQDHLNNAMYGPRQTNPDERRQYLGSLRERVLLRVDNATMRQAATLPALREQLPALVGGDHHALINGKLDASVTGPVMKLLGQLNMSLTMVNDASAQTADSATGLLVVSNQAVNQEDITLHVNAAHPEAPKKKGLFGFFH
ncbi:YueI family protein [Lacticaseibacillus thailandensis]|nr:YueI family protein [Lacticaseibacillus thailandensis]